MAEFNTMTLGQTTIHYDSRLHVFKEVDKDRVALIVLDRDHVAAVIDAKEDQPLIYEPKYYTRLVMLGNQEFRIEIDENEFAEF